MTGLRLAPKLTLPPEAALQRFGILAMSGAGKSNTAVVMAEEMYDHEIPWVAIDPKGDWWGIRSSANGKKAGLAVPVFGGLHGDVPLEPTAGKLVAELVATERLTCVLDVSEFDTRQQQFRFLADFAEALLKKNRDPLHLFLEEADDYLPQSAREKGELPRCLGAWSRVVKRGRFRGIFATLITQRSASINKDVLYQIDTLIPMRITAPGDRKVIESWVVEHQAAKELVHSLGELADGEAWIWSPQRLKLMERVHFRRRRTFDSGETPKLGEERKVARLADVDLEAIKTQMADTIAKAKADDPKELRREIAELKKQLKASEREQPAPAPEVITERVEVPVVAPELLTRLEELQKDATRAWENAADLGVRAQSVFEDVAVAVRRLADRPPGDTHAARPSAAPVARTPVRGREGGSGTSPRAAGSAAPRGTQPPAGDVDLGRGAPAAFLQVLAQYPSRTRRQLAIQSGYRLTSSTFRNALSTLRGRGLIDVSGQDVAITEAGITAAGDVEPLPTGTELVNRWRADLGTGAPLAMFDAVVAEWPNWTTREAVAEEAGYSVTSSTFRNALSKLRTLELVDVNGQHLIASEELMGED